jgi:hypothetical protein
MKQIYLFLFLCVCLLFTAFKALSQCSVTAFYDFGPKNGASANTSLTQNGVTMTVSNTIVSGTTMDAFVFNNTHKGGVNYGIYVDHGNTTGGAPGAKTKLSFSEPLSQLSFSLWDVDASGTKKDSIQVKAYSGPNVVTLASPSDFTVGTGGCVAFAGPGSNAFVGTTNNSPDASATSACGDVNLKLSGPIDSVVIFSSVRTGTSGTFSFGIGNISWCKNTNIPSSVAPGSFNFSSLNGQSANRTVNSNVGGVNVTISQQLLQGTTAQTGNFVFNDNHKNAANNYGIHLNQAVSNPGVTQGSKTKLAFSRAIVGLKLSVWDIDGAATKRDSITVNGYREGSIINLSPADYATGACVAFTNGNNFRAGTFGSATDEPCGDVNISFPTAVDSVIIFATQGFQGDNTAFSVSIGNLSFSNSFALPAGMKEWTGVLSGNNVLLKWSTSGEAQVKKYDVERSLNAQTFTTIGSVAAKGDAVSAQYDFNDRAIKSATGTVYYRLKIVDNDDQFSYSSVLAIHIKDLPRGSFALYPNPAKKSSVLNIGSDRNEKVELLVTDAQGRQLIRKIYQLNMGTNSITIPDLVKLGSGTYNVTVVGSDFRTNRKLVVVN